MIELPEEKRVMWPAAGRDYGKEMLHKMFDSMLICTNVVIGGFKIHTSILVLFLR